eukprot:5907451-Prymnesium_polylepis.1
MSRRRTVRMGCVSCASGVRAKAAGTTSGCGARLWSCCSPLAKHVRVSGFGKPRVHRGAGPLRV